jgi:hypothetical protein
MPLLSLTPLASKVLKDCFKSTIEYSFVSVPANGQHAPAQEVKKKVQIMHQVFNIEALLIWRSTFEELADDKNWNAAAKFTNARLLLGGSCKAKWSACTANHLGNAVATNGRFNTTMAAFMQRYVTSHGTEKLCDLITSAKKPASMSIRDFVTRIDEINRYLPYLPPPLNEILTDKEILLVIRRSVPSWNNQLDRTAVRMNNIQEITSYYQSLEEVEIRTNRNNNRNNNNSNNNNNDCNRDRVVRHNINNNNNRNDRPYNNNNNRNNNDNRNRNNNQNNNNNNRNNNVAERTNSTSPRNNNNNNNDYNRNRNNNTNNNGNNNNYNNNRNNNSNNHNYNLRPRREANNIEEIEDDMDNMTIVSERSSTTNRSNRSRTSYTSAHNADNDDEIYQFDGINRIEPTSTTFTSINEMKQTSNKTTTEEDFHPEVVVSILQDSATKSKRILRALIDTGSSTTVLRSSILPKMVL